MKRSLLIILLLAALVGGATWYGLSRSGVSAALNPETNQKLMLAGKFVENGQASKAIEVLDGLTADGVKLGEEGEYIQVTALEAAGDHTKAAEAARAFLAKYPETAKKTDVEVVRLSSELATAGLTNPVLRQSIEEFVAANPDHKATVRLQSALARQDLAIGDYPAARRRLSEVMTRMEDTGELLSIAKVLGETNMQKLMSPSLGEGDVNYTVERGDTINGIANKHGVTEELLLKCNGISNPRMLRIGQTLKIPNVKWSMEVDIAGNTLALNNHGQLFKLYQVRTGREAGATPVGEFKVLNKKNNPTWRPGNGYAYPPGDPNNELGTRWMSFEGDILGIHGTVHPETVGHYASNGCVGMTREDVEELFDLITVGTPLTIKGQQDLARHKVIPAPEIPPPMEMAKK